MTTKRFYETAEVLIYDPVAPNRNATRASLYSLGFRKVELAPTLSILQDHLKSRAPDLLLAEVAGFESETCATIQAMRQGDLGGNPFALAIVTSWRRDGSLVSQVLNAGADDLVARPVSTAGLGDRIRLLAERRKGFVVTSDYIGPDRRHESRTGGAECIEAPNPLKLRALDNITEEEAERLIGNAVEHGKERLNREKVRRDAVQLCLQWRMLEQRPPGTRDFREILPRMDRLAYEIKRRTGAVHQDAAQQWCDSIQSAIETLSDLALRAGEPILKDYQAPLSLLGHAALTLGQMFAAEEVGPARLVALDETMTARNARTAAA
jgi:DNA-binding response OmpR family regulator